MSDMFATEPQKPFDPRFVELLRSSNRPGIEKLIDWLINETDFFTAPASTRFHGAFEGGLLAHSLAHGRF